MILALILYPLHPVVGPVQVRCWSARVWGLAGERRCDIENVSASYKKENKEESELMPDGYFVLYLRHQRLESTMVRFQKPISGLKAASDFMSALHSHLCEGSNQPQGITVILWKPVNEGYQGNHYYKGSFAFRNTGLAGDVDLFFTGEVDPGAHLNDLKALFADCLRARLAQQRLSLSDDAEIILLNYEMLPEDDSAALADNISVWLRSHNSI